MHQRQTEAAEAGPHRQLAQQVAVPDEPLVGPLVQRDLGGETGQSRLSAEGYTSGTPRRRGDGWIYLFIYPNRQRRYRFADEVSAANHSRITDTHCSHNFYLYHKECLWMEQLQVIQRGGFDHDKTDTPHSNSCSIRPSNNRTGTIPLRCVTSDNNQTQTDVHTSKLFKVKMYHLQRFLLLHIT